MKSRWTIGAKISTGFAVAIIIIAALNIVSYQGMLKLVATNGWVSHTHQVQAAIKALLSDVRQSLIQERGYLLAGGQQDLAPYSVTLKRLQQDYQTLRRLTSDNPEEQHRLDTLQPLIKKELALQKKAIGLRKNNSTNAIPDIIRSGEAEGLIANMGKVLGEMTATEDQLLEQRVSSDQAAVNHLKLSLAGGTIGSLLLFGLIAVVLTRNISAPLKRVSAAAERIMEGDLGIAMPQDQRRDEIGVLTRSFRGMLAALQGMADAARRIAGGDLTVHVQPQSERDILGNAFADMVSGLKQLASENQGAVNTLSSSAQEILASTTQMATSASETAAAVNETTTTVSQVRQTAELVAQKVKGVSDNAQRLVQTAEGGNKATEEVIEAMEHIREQTESIAESIVRLSEQSQAIGEIIATVNDLAEQSNLLAVNAAIEAVKAGEQGKGFAVVAQEIKALAEQSKEATAQVRTILTDVQKSMSSAVMLTEQGSRAVQTGTRQTAQAGTAIKTLSDSVTDTAQVALQIAASTQQQTVGMEQIAQAMDNIKQAGQQNAAAARQTEESARGLNDIGAKLREQLGRFTLSSNHAP